MLMLKSVLKLQQISQSELARRAGVSAATVAQLVNHGLWPKSPDPDALKAKILDAIGSDDAGVFEECPALGDDQGEAVPSQPEDNDLEMDMLLRKQTLLPQTRRAFGLLRDPFEEVRSADEVFLNSDFRYVREYLRSTARHGGFTALVGESGAGKSTMRRDLLQWVADEEPSIIVIEPYVLGMEDNDVKGKTLKAGHIAEAIMAAVAPGLKLFRSPEARFRQVHAALRESHRAGNRHVLVIEEAHGLPIPTLKHLKRFFELEDGFAKLISIVLIGQSELAQKLDERNPSVREVVQRCEVVTLRPLDLDLEAYLGHRFQMVSKGLADVMDEPAVEALRTKLSGRGTYSVLYPLAVHNVMTAALNEAAKLGVPKLNADLIREV